MYAVYTMLSAVASRIAPTTAQEPGLLDLTLLF